MQNDESVWGPVAGRRSNEELAPRPVQRSGKILGGSSCRNWVLQSSYRLTLTCSLTAPAEAAVSVSGRCCCLGSLYMNALRASKLNSSRGDIAPLNRADTATVQTMRP